FIWGDDNPYNKIGRWDSSRQEYNEIIHDIFSTPKYLGMFVQKSVIGTLKELTLVNHPEKFRPGGNAPAWMIKASFEDEANEHNGSRQNTENLSASGFNSLYLLIFVASLIWIGYHPQVLKGRLPFLYAFIVAFLVVNAAIMSAFSAVLDRYQNRVFWVL